MPSVDTMTTSPTAPRRAGIARQLGIDTQYVLLGFPLGILTAVVTWVAYGVGIGLSNIVVGLPVLLGAVYVARGFATLERARAEAVLGEQLRRPIYRAAPAGASFWRK